VFYNSFLKRNAVSFTGCRDSLSSLVSHLEFGQGKWKGPQKNTHTHTHTLISSSHVSMPVHWTTKKNYFSGLWSCWSF